MAKMIVLVVPISSLNAALHVSVINKNITMVIKNKCFNNILSIYKILEKLANKSLCVKDDFIFGY
jgi:hypothetical protein